MTGSIRRPRRSWLVLLVAFATALAVLVPPASAQPSDSRLEGAEPAPVAPELTAQAEASAASGEPLQAVLSLEATADLAAAAGDRDEVVAALQRMAAESQAAVAEQIELRQEELEGLRVLNALWITNVVLVELPAARATAQLSALAAIPGVERIVPNFELTTPEPAGDEAGADTIGDLTWGIDRIEADRVWDELGIDGAGVRVATLDTGVDIAHPDLAGKMVTDNPSDPNYPGGWMEFDSAGNLVESVPHDSGTHGTHVSGTVQGSDDSGVSIGVAPGSDLMHGLVIPGGSGQFVQVAAGMQWAIAPTDADGNPAGEPAHVVNMSLGAGAYIQDMVEPTRNMRAAGIFPAFAIGNENIFGSCGVGSSSPGNVFEAVGVGATDIDDNVAGFSCGNVVAKDDWDDPPAEWPDTYVKPDLSAPGVSTWSARPGGGYGYSSGTSMASPHIAGTVALMRSAAPDLSVDQIQQTLEDTSFWDDRHGPDRPNTRYGHGRINAYESTVLVAFDSGVTGTVTDASTGNAIADAKVTITDTGTTISTDEDGDYTIRLAPGSYTLEASAFAYETATATAVVVEDQFTEVDFALGQLPTGTVAGTVTFAASGEGVPGVRIELLGTPCPRRPASTAPMRSPVCPRALTRSRRSPSTSTTHRPST